MCNTSYVIINKTTAAPQEKYAGFALKFDICGW